MKTLFAAASLLSVLALGAAPALAQNTMPPIQYQPDPDSPIGTRNPAGPAQLAEFDFVIGDWDVSITFTPPNGQAFTYDARWHNHWILDGLAVMQEWRGPYATGAEFRGYNLREGHWEGYNIYPTLPNGWRPTTALRSDEAMVVTIEGIDAEGPMLNRETYTDITADSFRMYSEISRDEGVSWETGRYSMMVVRRGG
ncbi:hypothetical protein [uncultured Maricaulis sp.]|uniref:hypothetical protein n=1 Tax=uncultured Maricaulis sp. TaxID=174710 RepID=UPI0030D7C1B6|tara:strand:+ start:26856 stop:27446 length:591 start_codon:yes stop_codon:yes gene_type:complete